MADVLAAEETAGGTAAELIAEGDATPPFPREAETRLPRPASPPRGCPVGGVSPMVKKAPVRKRALDTISAYKHSVDMPPSFSMRAKSTDPADKEVRPGATAYSLGNQGCKGAMTAPFWTMGARGNGIPKAPDQPGPGEYAQPSTLYGTHPMLPVAGRVPTTTTKRSTPSDALTIGGPTPAPHDYKVTADGEFGHVGQSKAPKFTCRAKIQDPADKEVRPGATAYTLGKASRTGIMEMPSWTMGARGSGIPKPPDQPGPGEYAQPSTLYGSHPMLPVAGRVPITTTKRSTPSDALTIGGPTPAPHDYKVTADGEFGHVGQSKAPKFTCRAKIQDPADKEVRPGATAYTLGKASRTGTMEMPSWTMGARGSGIPKPPDQPGPGEYAQPSTLYGSHPMLPVAGRVPITTTKRSTPSDALTIGGPTPAPHDYKVTADGEFGHVGQSKAPKFTCRAKIQDPADKEVRPGATAYTLGKASRTGTMETPSWTMGARGSGIPKPPDQPGPGEYAQPSTLYGSHPMLPVAGRVPITTTKRSTPSDALTIGGPTPAPHDYKVTADGEFGHAGQSKAPKFTCRAKIQDPADKEVRPGATAYTLGKASRTGKMEMPSWTMGARGSGIPKPPNQPGPGEYAQPSTLYGSHPMLPVAGRVPRSTTERFKEHRDERPD